MKTISNLKSFKTHTGGLFVILGVLPLIFTMLMGSIFSYIELRKDFFSKLNYTRSAVKNDILHQFIKIKNESYLFQHSIIPQKAAEYFITLSDENRFALSLKLKETFLPRNDLERSILWMNEYKNRNQYKDILFINSKKEILFSFENPAYTGIHLNTAGEQFQMLSKAVEKAYQKNDIYISDMSFLTSEEEAVSFICIPLSGRRNVPSGIYVFFYPSKNFSQITKDHQEYSNSLETYIIGEDFYFRTDSRFLPDAPLKMKAETEATKRAFRHITGNDHIKDYRDVSVLSSFTYMGLDETLHLDFDWIIVAEVDVLEAYESLISLVSSMATITLILILLSIYFGRKFSSEITDPILNLADLSEKISTGNFNVSLPEHSRYKEFASLSLSYNTMIETFRKISASMKKLASGNTNIPVHKDDTNPIILSMNEMIETLNEYSSHAKEVARGNYNQTLHPKSDDDDLGNSLNLMTENLKKTRNFIESNDWLRNGRTIISEIAHDTSDIQQMCYAYLMFFTDYLLAQAGVFYLPHFDKKEPEFHITAQYGIPESYKPKEIIKKDDGLIGSYFYSKAGTKILKNVDGNYLTYGSGLGEGKSGYVLLFPFKNAEKTLGVLEIFFTNEIRHEIIELLEETQNTVASSLGIAFENSKTRELLEKTTSQAEELQAQQEELRVINEEMGEKNKILEKQKEFILDKNKSLEQMTQEIEFKAQELEKANRYKSEFLANMSHELRTPLNSLLLLSGKLEKNRDGNLTERQVKSLNIIHQSGNALLTLINGILDLAKIEAGKMELNLAETSIQGIIHEIESTFQDPFRDKHIALDIQTAQNVPKDFITDAQKVIQILRNLISNSLKFTEKGSVAVQFALSRKKDTDCLQISITDTGIGIPEDKVNAIFEAFQQVDGSISRTYGGTGLGLTITKEMTKQLSGFIEVESELKKGTEFRIFLPLNLQPEKDEMSVYKDQTPAAAPAPERKLPGAKNNILIIEDDADYGHILIDLCKSKNFQCIYASDGESGLEIAKNQNIDAIILDYRLPGISGEEVLEILKSSEKTKNIPVQIISGLDKADGLLKKGAIGYLKKPASEEQIFESLDLINHILTNPVSRMLIFEPGQELKEIFHSAFENNLILHTANSGKEAIEFLVHNDYDCLVLDIDQEDFLPFEFLEQIQKFNKQLLPVIIYTKKELTESEHVRFNDLASSIVIKSGKSLERLVAESRLFLNALEQGEDNAEILQAGPAIQDLIGRKILIIDDDMRNLFALSEELEEEGMTVAKASGGNQALHILEERSEPFDVIISDIMMPEMDGYETMKNIRKMMIHGNTPIIALTAKAMKEDRELCIMAGASRYITKPVDRNKLLDILTELTGRK